MITAASCGADFCFLGEGPPRSHFCDALDFVMVAAVGVGGQSYHLLKLVSRL